MFVSDSLKRVVNRYSMPSFVARYGGDEFILILHPAAAEEADRLIGELRAEVEQGDRETSFPLSISAGAAELNAGPDTIQSCIKRADQMLYRDKANRKRRAPRVTRG